MPEVEDSELGRREQVKDLDNIQPINYAVPAKPHTPVYKTHCYFARRPLAPFARDPEKSHNMREMPVQTMDGSPFYPISLDAVTEEVARANGRKRRPTVSRGAADQLALFSGSNLRRQINEFGEELTRVDGDIPADLPVGDGTRFLFISYDQSALTHGLQVQYSCSFRMVAIQGARPT